MEFTAALIVILACILATLGSEDEDAYKTIDWGVAFLFVSIFFLIGVLIFISDS